MRYQVPQFIDVEDKIFGPLTLKQFLYLGGGAGISFILWSILPGVLAIIVGGPVLGFFIALALYKVHGKFPLIFLIENMIRYYTTDKLYIWKKERKAIKKKDGAEKDPNSEIFIPRLSDSKLKDLTWGLDINETLNQYNEKVGLDDRRMPGSNVQ